MIRQNILNNILAHSVCSPKYAAHPYFTMLDREPQTVQTTHLEGLTTKTSIAGKPSGDMHCWARQLPNSAGENIYIKVCCLVQLLIWKMELFWLWLPLLGSALMAGSVTSRPVDQDQPMSPEDQQLAEVCGQMITILTSNEVVILLLWTWLLFWEGILDLVAF